MDLTKQIMSGAIYWNSYSNSANLCSSSSPRRFLATILPCWSTNSVNGIARIPYCSAATLFHPFRSEICGHDILCSTMASSKLRYFDPVIYRLFRNLWTCTPCMPLSNVALRQDMVRTSWPKNQSMWSYFWRPDPMHWSRRWLSPGWKSDSAPANVPLQPYSRIEIKPTACTDLRCQTIIFWIHFSS